MPSDVGSTLRQERIRQGYTHADIARALGVHTLTVMDLEEGRLPAGATRTLAYVRVYARHLGLDAEALLRRVADGQGQPDASGAGETSGSLLEAPDPLAPAAAGPAGRRFRRRSRNVPAAAPPLGAGAAAYQPADDTWQVLRRRPLVLLAGLGVLAAVVTAGAVIALAGGQREPSVTLTAPPERPAEPAVEQPSPDATVDPEPSPPAPEPPQALEGRPPQETPVQVLHAGVDEAVVDEAVATLEALGYPIVAVSPVTAPLERTTVFHVEGWETEARALGEREPRFGEPAPNPGFTADARLHVAIGQDWPMGES